MSNHSEPFALTPRELEIIQTRPVALRELADWHEVQATEADSMGIQECVDFHDDRKKAILAEAQRREQEMIG